MAESEEPQRLDGIQVTHNLFDILRKQPTLGRIFTPAEERADGPRVALLSDGLWQTRFAADRDVLGRVVNLDGIPHEIIGVLPPDMGLGQTADIWMPFRFTGQESRSLRYLAVYGRIRDGADLDQARTDLNMLQQGLAATYAENRGTGINMWRLQDEWFDEGFRQGSLIAGTAVFFVLLIACANVANLLLARATARQREVALRTAVGAGRARIIRQLLTESLILALAGGVIGLLVAIVGVRWLRGLFPPFLEGVSGVTLSGRVMMFTAAISILSGLVFGIAPALRGSVLDLRGLLTDANRGTTGARGNRLRTGLVVGEISLAVVLLIASVLLIHAFSSVRSVPLGFALDRTTMAVTLPATKYPTGESMEAFQTQLLDRVAAIPGVESVGATHLLPFQGNTSRSYVLPDEPPAEPGREPVVNVRFVSPNYFEAMEIPRIAGRSIGTGDRRGAPAIAVINQAMAQFQWPDRNAIGQRIRFGEVDHEIVGVVGNTRDFGPDDEGPRMVYVPLFQNDTRTMSLAVAGSAAPGAIVTAIREAVLEIDPEQPVYAVSTLATMLDDEMSGNAAMMKVLGLLGIIAFLLAAVGVYGVMAYSVAQRTQELGIRMALGAQRNDVMSLVLRRGALITGLGILIGTGISFAVMRGLAFFLFGVSPYHPIAFATVPVLLGLTGAVASLLPALRATRVSPLIALRTS
jgi:predicted permease